MINFTLDHKSGVPFYQQLVNQIKFGISAKNLLPGEQLPTVRALAVELEVNPNTIRKAYSDLEILGIIDTQQGTGTFVGSKTVEIGKEDREQAMKSICDELIAEAHQYNISLAEIVEHLQRRIKHGK